MARTILLTILAFVEISISQNFDASPGFKKYKSCSKNSVVANGITIRDMEEIVNVHNYIRMSAANGLIQNQPKASNMLRLVWDDILAAKAQNTVNTCSYDPPVYDSRFSVGSNYYTWTSGSLESGQNWTEAIETWLKQLYYDKYEFGKENYNAYTQLIWAKTRYVGCGFMHYYEDKWYNKLYICYYGPKGNIEGQTPYEIGNGCEKLCKV